MSGDLGRPIRVVIFGGAFPERSALIFLARLTSHPEIEFVGGVYAGEGFAWTTRIREIIRRRGVMAPVAISFHLAQAIWPWLRNPLEARRVRRAATPAFARIFSAHDIHASDVLEQVRGLDADLGLIYGAPILKPALFNLPRMGTLGIHHGTLPQYRGKKTTFWAVYNGEHETGIAIQRVNAGLDTGEIIREGAVTIGGKGYGRVDREVHELGVELYVQAILDLKRGTSVVRAQPSGKKSKPYRQPGLIDTMKLLLRWPSRSLRG